MHVFVEVAPRAARAFGPTKVREICEQWAGRQNQQQFRRWVRVHWGTGPLPWRGPTPAQHAPKDPVTGRYVAKKLTNRPEAAQARG
jgi:hypothetical protein